MNVICTRAFVYYLAKRRTKIGLRFDFFKMTSAILGCVDYAAQTRYEQLMQLLHQCEIY
jgi:hypothetical protein